MRWSFRTNGNYVDFVHTDETSEAVESTIFHLHNTSRCVSWSLSSDTTRINFTIDEVKYSNILITDIDFDGTAMNSQDDFETGITGMFAGLASSPGGDSGLALESYQNSAMSSAVMAYVFRDESDNIFRVYEPIRNNDISRKTFPYADSIDKFRFDKAENYNNNFRDVKLDNVHANTVIHSCTFLYMIINCNNHTGVELSETVFIGSYGDYGNGIELEIKGNTVVFSENVVGYGVYFNGIGANSSIVKSTFLGYMGVEVQDFTGLLVTSSTFGNGCTLAITENDVDINTIELAAGATLNAAGINGSAYIGTNKSVSVAVSDLTSLKNVDAEAYSAGGVAGVDGSFVDDGGNTITITKGIITAITPP